MILIKIHVHGRAHVRRFSCVLISMQSRRNLFSPCRDESEKKRERESEREKFSANVEYEFRFARVYACRVWLTHLPHNRHTLTHAIFLQHDGKRLRSGLHCSVRTRTQTHAHTQARGRAHTSNRAIRTWMNIVQYCFGFCFYTLAMPNRRRRCRCRRDRRRRRRRIHIDTFLLTRCVTSSSSLLHVSSLCVSASTMPRSAATAVAAVCDCVCFFASSISTRFLLTLQFCHSFRWYHFVHTIENAYF